MHGKKLNTLNELDTDQFSTHGGIISVPESESIYLLVNDQEIDPVQCADDYFGSISLFQEREVSFSIRNYIKTNKSDLKEFLNQKLKNKSSLPAIPLENTDHIYQEDFKNLMNEFKKGLLKKVVLKSRQYYSVNDVSFSILSLISSFLDAPNGYIYGIWNKGEGYLGLTPETLLIKEKNLLKTMALAGTRSHDKRDELLSDEKEMLEHNLVIADIKAKLSDEKLEIGKTKLMDYNRVSHLFTPIEFVSNAIPLQLVKRLTPTAALGGYPSEEAKLFLKNSLYHQKFSDSFFGGATFLEAEERFSSFVNIRNIQWNKDKFWIESGTGIVESSVLEKELNEIKLKRGSIEELIFE